MYWCLSVRTSVNNACLSIKKTIPGTPFKPETHLYVDTNCINDGCFVTLSVYKECLTIEPCHLYLIVVFFQNIMIIILFIIYYLSVLGESGVTKATSRCSGMPTLTVVSLLPVLSQPCSPYFRYLFTVKVWSDIDNITNT